jgi:hypothetical protein
MKILGLDMSTKTGYAIINNDSISSFGLLTRSSKTIEEKTQVFVEDFGYLADAKSIAVQIVDLIKLNNIDYIYIEQTNKGRNRTSQKQLEFIHCCVLSSIKSIGMAKIVRYVDTSAWRKALKIKTTKQDSAHNKLVKSKKAKGKITTKHLAVRWANSTYNLNLLIKDNDIADAIAVATYGIKYESNPKPEITERDIEKIFQGVK